jgi:hypothetical protein
MWSTEGPKQNILDEGSHASCKTIQKGFPVEVNNNGNRQ